MRTMKHKLFLLIWLAVLASLFVAVGVLSLLGYPNVEISFWTTNAIESRAGRIAWVVLSSVCLLVFVVLAAREFRTGNDGSPGENSD